MSGTKYNGLNDLLTHSTTARQYFSSLPVHVQTSVKEYSSTIKTEDELRAYAQNVINEDK